MHLVSARRKKPGQPGPAQQSPKPDEGSGPAPSNGDVWTEMARAVVEEIEVGQFRSTDCQRIIKDRWPKHPLASAVGASFGAEFKSNIWPGLEGWGVEISNPGKNPIKYEMVEKAKPAAG